MDNPNKVSSVCSRKLTKFDVGLSSNGLKGPGKTIYRERAAVLKLEYQR